MRFIPRLSTVKIVSVWALLQSLGKLVDATSVLVQIMSPNGASVVRFDDFYPSVVQGFEESAVQTSLGEVTEVSAIPAGFSALKLVCEHDDGAEKIWASFNETASLAFKANVTSLAQQSCVFERIIEDSVIWKGACGVAGYATGFILVLSCMRKGFFLENLAEPILSNLLTTMILNSMGALAITIPLSNYVRIGEVPTAMIALVMGGVAPPLTAGILKVGAMMGTRMESCISDCTLFAQNGRHDKGAPSAAELLLTAAASSSAAHGGEYQSTI